MVYDDSDSIVTAQQRYLHLKAHSTVPTARVWPLDPTGKARDAASQGCSTATTGFDDPRCTPSSCAIPNGLGRPSKPVIINSSTSTRSSSIGPIDGPSHRTATSCRLDQSDRCLSSRSTTGHKSSTDQRSSVLGIRSRRYLRLRRASGSCCPNHRRCYQTPEECWTRQHHVGNGTVDTSKFIGLNLSLSALTLTIHPALSSSRKPLPTGVSSAISSYVWPRQSTPPSESSTAQLHSRERPPVSYQDRRGSPQTAAKRKNVQ